MTEAHQESLPVLDIVPPLQTSKSEQNVPTRSLPKVTTSSSEEYITACALSSARATTDDPLNLLFAAEKLPPLPGEPAITATSRPTIAVIRQRLKGHSIESIQQAIYDSCLARLRFKMSLGNRAFIAEAADFNAVALWEPLYAPTPEEVGESDSLDPGDANYAWDAIQRSPMIYHNMPIRELVKQRPVFADFGVKIDAAKKKHLYPVLWKNAPSSPSSDIGSAGSSTEEVNGNSNHLLYWHLCLMSRDPTKPPVKGAVRAVIEPFVKKFIEEEGVAVVWLEAGSPRARDVYGWLGFKVVEELISGGQEGDRGISTWCMMYMKDQ